MSKMDYPRPTASHLDLLLRFGGFPEPLFRQDEAEHRIWQRDRLARVVREDLRDLERVREVSLVEQLVDLLPERVGSPLSVANLRQDLEVDHKTVERWLTILENMYVCFRLPPFGSPRIRAVKKEKKLYLWDWSAVADPGARFENLVACQLLKYCRSPGSSRSIAAIVTTRPGRSRYSRSPRFAPNSTCPERGRRVCRKRGGRAARSRPPPRLSRPAPNWPKGSNPRRTACRCSGDRAPRCSSPRARSARRTAGRRPAPPSVPQD
jgi:hypothetical protein